MKAQEFDQKFDDGEDITHLLDLSQAKRPLVGQAIVSINLPIWMIELIDREADRLGVTPQAIIQTSLASQFALHNPQSAKIMTTNLLTLEEMRQRYDGE